MGAVTAGVEVAVLYTSPVAPTFSVPPLRLVSAIGLLNLLRRPEKVFESESSVEEAAVPAATLMVKGEEPNVVKVLQVALPVQVTVVVALP